MKNKKRTLSGAWPSSLRSTNTSRWRSTVERLPNTLPGIPKVWKALRVGHVSLLSARSLKALRVGDTAPFCLELVRTRRDGRNPSSSKSTESSHWQRRQKRGAKDSLLDLANKPRAKSKDARQAAVLVAKENIPLLASVSPCWRTFPTSVDNNISHRPLSPYTERQPIRASYSGNKISILLVRCHQRSGACYQRFSLLGADAARISPRGGFYLENLWGQGNKAHSTHTNIRVNYRLVRMRRRLTPTKISSCLHKLQGEIPGETPK